MSAHITRAAAAGLASLGRGEDSTLVHMTPKEVEGLQKLAAVQGTSLTINPHTGLPEAGVLSSLLPMLSGAALNFFAPGSGLLLQGLLGAGVEKLSNKNAGVSDMLMGAMGGMSGAGIENSLFKVGASPGFTPTADAAKGATADAAKGATALNDAGQTSAKYYSSLNPDQAAISLSQRAEDVGKGFNDLSGVYKNMGALKAIGATSSIAPALLAPAQAAIPPNSTRYISGSSYNPGTQNANFGTAGAAGKTSPFLGQQYMPGTLSNTYTFPTDVATNPNGTAATYTPPVGGKAGGSVAHLAEGGSASTGINPSTVSNPFSTPAASTQPVGNNAMYNYYQNMFSSPITPTGTNTSGSNVSYDPSQHGYADPKAGTVTTTGPNAAINSYLNQLSAEAPATFVNYANPSAPPPAPYVPKHGPGAGMDVNAGGNPGAGSGMRPDSANVSGTKNVPNKSLGLGSMGNMPNYSPIIQGYGYNLSDALGANLPKGSVDVGPLEGYSFGSYGGDNPGGNKKAGGSIGTHHYATGGMSSIGQYSDGGQLLKGPGDGMSDSIPAMIHGNKPQRAALADGEFVVPADVVSHLGNGSTSAGANKLYSMMRKIRKARTGNPKQGKQINPDKYLPS